MTQREENLVALLRAYHDCVAGDKNGHGGDGAYAPLMPKTYTASVRELERCMREMRKNHRPLWYAVYERYIAAMRKPTEVLVRNYRPVVPDNVQVLSLVDKTRLNTHGNGYARVRVEIWNPRVRHQRVKEGVAVLSTLFRGEPCLPTSFLEGVA